MTVTLTSKMTYFDIIDSGLVGKMQARVLTALRVLGRASDLDLVNYLQEVDPNRVRPRRNDLYVAGLVKIADYEEQNGRLVTIWELQEEPVSIDRLLQKKTKQVKLTKFFSGVGLKGRERSVSTANQPHQMIA